MIRRNSQRSSKLRRVLGIMSVATMISGAMTPQMAAAAGPSGTVTITAIRAEGDAVFVYVSGASNPDSCGAATVVKLIANNATELDRMYSLALTAMVTGRSGDFWLSGCVNTNWGFTIPQAASIYVVNS